MARLVRGAGIDTREKRRKLAIQREPYWVKIAKGCYLGYRKMVPDSGTWIARFRSKAGRQQHKSIGAADDAMDADGDTALSFEQAQAKARDWYQTAAIKGEGTIWRGKFTVSDAMTRYLGYVKAHRKSYRHLDTYIKAYILPKLGNIEVAEISTPLIRQWHEAIAAEAPRLRTRKGNKQKYRAEDPDPREARRKRQLRANRQLTTLKAALNLSWRDGLVPYRDAWERVRPFSKVERQRTRFLSQDEARRLINTCEPDLRNLVRAALLTGARYGELCALDVRDYRPEASSLYIRDSKSGKARHIYLSDEGEKFFQRLTVGRTPTEALLARDDGGRWSRDLHFRPFKAALKRAGIEDGFTFHELRHTWASLTIMAGAPLIVVAQNLGHRDTRMVELHYGHLTNSFVRSEIRKAAPVFFLDNEEKVVSM